jgi:hypothetical protein
MAGSAKSSTLVAVRGGVGARATSALVLLEETGIMGSIPRIVGSSSFVMLVSALILAQLGSASLPPGHRGVRLSVVLHRRRLGP